MSYIYVLPISTNFIHVSLSCKSYLYQRIFYVSPLRNDIYVQPISTNFTHVSLSCMSFLFTAYINKFYICLIIRIIVMSLCHTYINELSMCLLVRMISMSNLYQRISHMFRYHVCHFYVQPISTNSIYVSLSESKLCHTYINEFSMSPCQNDIYVHPISTNFTYV